MAYIVVAYTAGYSSLNQEVLLYYQYLPVYLGGHTMATPVYVGIELGGTKTLCTAGASLGGDVKRLRIATTSASETLQHLASFIGKFEAVAGIGIAAFGPINLDKRTSRYGVMENTPKPGWKDADIYTFFSNAFGCPVVIDTDVNAAGLAEHQWGAAQGLNNFIYVTVGTGIGAGGIVNGRPIHGLSHPEMGHLSLPRVKGDGTFVSSCPFHKSCAEGLASGTAISARWGAPLNELPLNHPAWDLEAEYLAEFTHTLTLTYSPEKIILGGGVASEPLLKKVREKLFRKLNGYVHALTDERALVEYVCLPKLGDTAGPDGSFLLATSASSFASVPYLVDSL